jgi:hypothetical protein
MKPEIFVKLFTRIDVVEDSESRLFKVKVMSDQAVAAQSIPLPLRRNLTPLYILSLIIVLVTAAASIVALLYPTTIYPTEALQVSFMANDLVNLCVSLPVLLGSLWLTRRGRLVGLLFWPGALFVTFYNSIAYVVSLPVNVGFLLNLLLLVLSAYTTIALVSFIDAPAVQRRLAGVAPERLAGGALSVWGILFILIVFGSLLDPLLTGAPVAISDRALHIADLIIAPALVIGGLLLWRRRPLGYVAGVGLLFQVNMLFVGVIAVLILQPLFSSEPLRLDEIGVLAVMWLVGLIPFVLFARSIWTKA